MPQPMGTSSLNNAKLAAIAAKAGLADANAMAMTNITSSLPKTDFSQFGQLGFNSNVAGTPRESLVAAEPQHYEPLGNQIAPSQDSVLSDALYKAATFEPSENAALRAIRDAIPQNLGLQPTAAPVVSAAPKAEGLSAATPVAQTTTSTPVSPGLSGFTKGASTTPGMSDARQAAQTKMDNGYQLNSNDIAAMSDAQREAAYKAGMMTVGTPTGNFFNDLFSGKLGSTVEQIPSNQTHESNYNQQGVAAAPVSAPVAAAPVETPVVPGQPVPYTYPKKVPYLDYGAYGAGIGNITPIAYNDPINWALVPGYRATGGRVGENNALANVLRMLAQNRS